MADAVGIVAVTDWRYWITYEGRVQAGTEAQAQVAAYEELGEWVRMERTSPHPTIEVEEIENG